MFSKISTLGALAAMATSVAAHGTVTGMSVNGVYTTGWLLQYAYETDPPASVGWTEAALDNGYVSDYGSADIICHKNATNAQAYLNVTAGDKVVLYWTTWPDSHKGPVTSYLASCGDDCTTVDKTTLEFVKFDEAGLITPGDDQVWATDNLIANNNSWTVTIPESIESGNWVLRHEILALHGAGSANGAQSYPFCINLDITGTGTDSPTGTLGESLYTATDPGVLVNIYTDLESYTIPGPAIPSVWGGSDNSTANSATSSASVASSTSAASSVATVASTSATSTAVVASTSATSSAVSVASSTAAASTSAATSASVSSISTQVVAATSTSAATSAAITSAASTASAASASASVASSVVSAISSLATALPSSVLTSAAPTATATTSSGATVSTAGMTVAELLDLLKQILVDLLGSSSTSSKARRHARAF